MTTTDKWGDIVPPFATVGGSIQPDFRDIASIVDKFKDLEGAPAKAYADLETNVPDLRVDFNDIAGCVDAFKGIPYPFDGPSGCP